MSLFYPGQAKDLYRVLLQYTTFVKILRRKAYFIVPINSKWVKRKIAEIIHILQLAADTFLHQWNEIHSPHLTITESEPENIILHIFGSGNLEYCFHMLQVI